MLKAQAAGRSVLKAPEEGVLKGAAGAALNLLPDCYPPVARL